MASGIYKITNTINGHCYIGSAININRRWRLHKSSLSLDKHHSVYLQRAWNKYGADSFDFSIIEYCSPITLIFREQYWIDALNPEYNIAKKAGNTIGVRNFGHKHTDEAKAKMAEKARGRHPTTETLLKMSEAGKKRVPYMRTPETSAKLSASMKGHPVSTSTREKLSKALKGKPSTALVGKKPSEETRLKISEAVKAWWSKNK